MNYRRGYLAERKAVKLLEAAGYLVAREPFAVRRGSGRAARRAAYPGEAGKEGRPLLHPGSGLRGNKTGAETAQRLSGGMGLAGRCWLCGAKGSLERQLGP
jgi:hypothetical protein